MSSATPARPRGNRFALASARAVLLLLRARAILVLLLLLVLFSALAPEFLTANNLSILTKHVAITALLAVGMTFVILTGGIDLSVGSIAGLGGMVAGYLLTQGLSFGGATHYPPVAIVILLAICACLLVGALNGWLVAKAGVAPFIATLGTLYIARGAALLISNGKTFPNLGGAASRGNTGFPAVRTKLSAARAHAGLDDGGALRRCMGGGDQDAVRQARLRDWRQ